MEPYTEKFVFLKIMEMIDEQQRIDFVNEYKKYPEDERGIFLEGYIQGLISSKRLDINSVDGLEKKIHIN